MNQRHLRVAVNADQAALQRMRNQRDALTRHQARRRKLIDEKHQALEANYDRHQRAIDNLTAQIEQAEKGQD